MGLDQLLEWGEMGSSPRRCGERVQFSIEDCRMKYSLLHENLSVFLFFLFLSCCR